MEKEFLNKYFNLVQELLNLHVQKEVYLQKVIENYGSHKADSFLKKIQEVEEILKGKNKEFGQVEQLRKKFEGHSGLPNKKPT